MSRIEIPSDIKYIREVSSKILKSLEPYNLNEGMLSDIRLCVEEAVRNSIVHGNLNDRKLPVTVDYGIETGNALIIDIADNGKGFDHNKVPDPTHEGNLLKGSGRGVYLIRKLMDKVEYNNKGNKIRLTKYLK